MNKRIIPMVLGIILIVIATYDTIKTNNTDETTIAYTLFFAGLFICISFYWVIFEKQKKEGLIK